MENKENIQLSPFEIDGKLMVDVRYWRITKKGPRPTQKGIEVEFRLIPQMISCFQKIWAKQHAEQAKEAALGR